MAETETSAYRDRGLANFSREDRDETLVRLETVSTPIDVETETTTPLSK